MILVLLALMISISGIVSCIKADRYLKKEREKETVRVLESHGAWITGTIGLCFLGPIAFLLPYTATRGESVVIFSLLGCCLVGLCNLAIFGWLHEIIVYDKDGFWKGWYPYFRSYYTYQQIVSYDRAGHKLIIHLDEDGLERIVLENPSKELDSFLNFVRIRHKQITGKELEKRFLKSKRDLYNGNLVNAGEVTFVIVFLIISSLGLTVFTLYEVFHERNESNTEYYELDLEYKEKNSDELIFEADGYKQEFVFSGWTSYDRNLLYAMLDSVMTDETLQLYARYYSGGKYRSAFYDLRHVQDMDGNVFITFQTGNASDKSIMLIFFLLSFLLFVMSVFGGIRSITVARHPERYGPNPKWVVFTETSIRRREDYYLSLEERKKLEDAEAKKTERIYFLFLVFLCGMVFVGWCMKQKESITNESVLIRDLELSENVYKDADYELPKRGDSYQVMLTQGEYLVGTHLPEGYYTMEKIVGEGSFRLEHPEYSIKDEYRWIQRDDLYWTIDAFPLYQGTKITVTNAMFLSLSTNTGQMNKWEMVAEHSASSNAAISLEEGISYIVGEDIPSGVYDFGILDGKSYLRLGLPNKNKQDSIGTVYREIWLDKAKNELYYHNLVLCDGMILRLDPNLDGECILRPARQADFDGYDTYYALYR